MEKSTVELRNEISDLKKAREKQDERQALVKERRELKYGKTMSAFRRFGGGIKGGLLAADKALVPQAYAKKKVVTPKKRKVKRKYKLVRVPIRKKKKRR